MNLQLTSMAFIEGKEIPANIPVRQGCFAAAEMERRSDAKSLVLIADDPDAPMGTWVHCVFDLPPTTTELSADVPKPSTARRRETGSHDFKRFGYGGPWSAARQTASLFFKLYALDTLLDLAGATKQDVEGDEGPHPCGRAVDGDIPAEMIAVQ
jgi:Raf kinase inhibitor-like YbhB/YbcL family protein